MTEMVTSADGRYSLYVEKYTGEVAYYDNLFGQALFTNPYNINRLTQVAGLMAVEENEYYVENCKSDGLKPFARPKWEEIRLLLMEWGYIGPTEIEDELDDVFSAK